MRMRRTQTAEKLPAFQECLGCPRASGQPCRVRELVNQTLFVEGAHAFLCYHRTSFENSYICRCPVRREIYDRHGC